MTRFSKELHWLSSAFKQNANIVKPQCLLMSNIGLLIAKTFELYDRDSPALNCTNFLVVSIGRFVVFQTYYR